MSKPPKKSSSKFHYTPAHTTPPLASITAEWDLSGLYYRNETDPQLEADVATAEAAYHRFIKKWRKRDFTSSATALAEALRDKEHLSGMPEVTRPGRYLSLRLALNTNDQAAKKKLALLERRFRKLSDEMLFFTLTLGRLPKQQQTAYLKAPELAHFHYYLQQVFESATHNLSEPEEKIINLKSSQSYGRWVDMTEDIVSNRTLTWQGKALAIPAALETIETLSSKQKPKLWSLIMKEMEQIAEVAEHEFNAIITDVRTEDELRGYEKPYSATALSYEDSEASIESLVEAVSTEGFKLSRRFYKLKAEYHGVEHIPYANKYDSIGNLPSIDFDEAVTICRDVFYSLKTEYGELFDTMLTNGQIDVYPKPGKRGGAFMSSQTNQPTQVMLNHTSTFKALETLAHEMGHAIHSERSKHHTPFYDGHSITTAETASTLFENLVFDAVYRSVTPKQQVVLNHDRLTRDIATIQRQITCFNAELEYHTTIHDQGAMTKEELRSCMEKHLKRYLGPAVAIQPQDGYSFVYWSHLRYGFYVYTYSFGLLMSTIMSERYKADSGYIDEIDWFLSSGSSMAVADIFKQINIDTTHPDVFREALKPQAAAINDFAHVVRQRRS